RRHARVARGIGGDPGMPVRALERESREPRLAAHRHVPRRCAAGRNRGAAPASPRAVAGDSCVHRERDGEPARGAAIGLLRAAGEHPYRDQAARPAVGRADRAIAELSFGSRDVTPVLKRLRNDSKYAFRSREAMLTFAEAALERAQLAMPRWFGVLPRAGVVIRSYAAFRERESVGEWDPPAEDGSRPGIFYLSTYDPKHKPRADVEPLTFHET